MSHPRRRRPGLRSRSARRLAPLLGLTLCGAGAARAAEPFVFVALPDTQIYAENRFPDGRTPAVTDPRGTGAIFFDQTRWIVENAAGGGIGYVGHLGDIVQDGNDLDEWALAKEAMDLLLEADIPHGTVMGNHDDNHGPDYAANYLAFFGPQEFEHRPWYTASSPSGGANLQLLEHEGRKLGFLNLSIDHPQAEIDWAKSTIEAHPDAIFILGTHRYLYDFKIAGGRYGEDVTIPLVGTVNLPANPIDAVPEANDAEELFDELVSQYPNILMIHAGHFHAEWLRLDGLNSAAKTVIQILTDYQSTRNGGDGWLRIYELDFDARKLRFDTWSPTLNRGRTTIDHYVETIFLAWDQRHQVMDVLDVGLEEYLDLLDLVFKQTPQPDGFLLQHPDFDEPEERAYYERYLDELFLGEPPEGFDDILEWEGMWMIGFAADSQDPFDFSDWVRSPRGEVDVDFEDYYAATPGQRVQRVFDDLVRAVAETPTDDFAFPFAAWMLGWQVEYVRSLAEEGDYLGARRELRRRVLRRTDGCRRRGEADASWFVFARHTDWVDRCGAQALLVPYVDAALHDLWELAVEGG